MTIRAVWPDHSFTIRTHTHLELEEATDKEPHLLPYAVHAWPKGLKSHDVNALFLMTWYLVLLMKIIHLTSLPVGAEAATLKVN